MRDTGIEPMSPAWKASMITTTLISRQFLAVKRYGSPSGAKLGKPGAKNPIIYLDIIRLQLALGVTVHIYLTLYQSDEYTYIL